ncbi:ImuA family protein [Cognatishimia sp.]|uniref:ImuA family protein n=1 Tax=Cognatishimia sp. TaxID=2211648 RepID=UPI0035196AE8
MSTHPLKRDRERPPPNLTLAPDVSLRQGRLHEACGPARRSLALWVASQMQGPVFWISPPWTVERLYPQGIKQLLHPGRVTFLSPTRAEDVLWTLEEVLRSGEVPLAIGDLPGLPALTPVRRLHLAAEQGGAAAGRQPLGLILTPAEGGAAGVESRWHMAPRHTRGLNSWDLKRLRARTAPVKEWPVTLGPRGFAIAEPQKSPIGTGKPKNDLAKVE